MTNEPIQEIENTADDGQWWQMFADLLEDVADSGKYGSLAALIFVGVMAYLLAPYLVAILRGPNK